MFIIFPEPQNFFKKNFEVEENSTNFLNPKNKKFFEVII